MNAKQWYQRTRFTISLLYSLLTTRTTGMAAELQPPPEAPVTLVATTAAASSAVATIPTAATVPPSAENVGAPVLPKRQRRPSVRLGEIGNQPATLSYEPHARRTKHPWRFPKDYSNPSSKPSKTRPLTNLVNGNEYHDSFDAEENQNGDGNFDLFSRKAKAKRGTTKRLRSNWVSRVDDGLEGDNREDGGGDAEFREFGPDSDSPLKDHSPVHSVDNVALDFWHRKPGRARVSESRENDPIELESLPESNSRDRKDGTGDGVRSWLIELGLGRYAPVFEIHEVDEEVLPMLTLEDLKDMGINAVGSRRKLYTAIQKLGKGFS